MTNTTIIERIRNLRAKAADAAASEAEANQAAAMAAKLLSKYDLEECDLNSTDSSNRGTVGGYQTHKRDIHTALRQCAGAIAKLTETSAYREDGTLKFIGTGPDVEMALYLVEMIRGAADRSWKDHRKLHGSSMGRAEMNRRRKSFMIGFGERLAERIRELAKERQRQRETHTGTDLVVIKKDIIEATKQELGLRLSKPRRRASHINMHSYAAGQMAGDNVNLNRPVEGGSTSTATIR